MKKHLLLFIGFFFSTIFAQNPASIPLNHPLYNFVERMETMGIVTDALDNIRPYSRGRAAELLKQIEAKRDRLTAIDGRRLDDLLLEFRFELQPGEKHALIPEGQNWYSTLASWENFKNDFRRVLSRPWPEEEHHVAMWEKDSSSVYFDFEQVFTADGRSDGLSRNANEQSYILQGVIDRDFAWRVKVSLQGVRGDEGYRELDPLIKGTFSQESEEGDVVFADRTGGELAWHTRYMDVHFAQQEIAWGHGLSGKLILSNNPEQYPYIAVSKSWGWGKFIALHGKLQSFQQGTLEDGTKIFPDKWVAAHRLEFSPWDPITIGLNEVFIYGNRYADWSYLIPFNFYRAVQHKLRDRDNATIAIDLEAIPLNGAKLYGTIFIDEMKFEKLGTDWWGNKHAFQGGVVLADPFRLHNTMLQAEYTAIMPWVYTHKFAVNRYESDGRSLGHPAGPNSEVILFSVSKDISVRWLLGLQWSQTKKGANYPNENIGGDLLTGENVLLGTQEEPRQTRRFLEGILTTTKQTELFTRYELFNDFFVSASYIFSDTRTESRSQSLNEWHLGIRFNY